MKSSKRYLQNQQRYIFSTTFTNFYLNLQTFLFIIPGFGHYLPPNNPPCRYCLK